MLDIISPLNTLKGTDKLMNYIHELFDYDEQKNSHIYLITLTSINYRNSHMPDLAHKTYNKLPIFFQEMLDKPSMFAQFLIKLQNIRFDKNTAVFKGANIITFLSCITFHLTNLYIMLYRNTKDYDLVLKDCAIYYHLPLGDWYLNNIKKTSIVKQDLSDILNVIGDWFANIVKQETVVKQNVAGFLNAYQYLILMSFVSQKLKMEDRPIYKYMQAISRKKAHFKINVVDDILKLCTTSHEDIFMYTYNEKYDFDVRRQYYIEDSTVIFYDDEVINIRWFYDDDINQDIFRHTYCNILKYTSNTQELHDYTMQNMNSDNYYMFLYVNSILGKHLGDIWKKALPHVLYMCKTSADLHQDLTALFAIIGHNKQLMKYENFIMTTKHFKPPESLLISIVNNFHFANNKTFIFKILEYVLTQNDTPNDILEASLILLRKSRTAELKDYFKNELDIIVLSLLQVFFSERNSYNIKSFSTSKFAYHSYKENENGFSPIKGQRKVSAIFKKLLTDCINRNKVIMSQDAKEKERARILLLDIYQYKDVLKQNMYIDLDSFNMFIHGSPKSLTNSVALMDKTPTRFEIYDKFKPFINQNLAKELSKVYYQTLQGTNADSKFDRIILVNKFLQKYVERKFKNTDYIMFSDVRQNTELSRLYDYWKKNYNILGRYIISYKDERGIDANGVTKHFLTNLCTQLQLKYFEPLDGDSSIVYIFNKNVDNDVAEFIGQLLIVLIMNDIKLQFCLSRIYIAACMFKIQEFTAEQIFAYYLLDIVNSKKYETHLETCSNETMQEELCTIDNEFLKEYVPYFYEKQDILRDFAKGFKLDKKLFHRTFQNINDKIGISDFDKMISASLLTRELIEKYIFNHMKISGPQNDMKTYDFLYYIMCEMEEEEYKALYEAYKKKTNSDNIIKYNSINTLDSFKKEILLFWTASYTVSINEYEINMITASKNGGYPIAHTCFNGLELPTSKLIPTMHDLFYKFMDICVNGINTEHGLV